MHCTRTTSNNEKFWYYIFERAYTILMIFILCMKNLCVFDVNNIIISSYELILFSLIISFLVLVSCFLPSFPYRQSFIFEFSNIYENEMKWRNKFYIIRDRRLLATTTIK